MKQPKKIFTRMLINNWGGISHKMLEFHEYVNLFSGKSGSGKSTVMDAIQVVLYGSVSANFLNKAADDSKNKRSVLSYLRGAQKDGTANRGDVDFCSQIVLEIEDTATHIVTCVGAAFEVAKGDTDLKKYTYFSHSGRIPKDEYLENNVPYSIAQIRKLTEERSRSADNRGRGEVNKVYPSKEAYLYTLYGEIFGQVEQGRMITMEKSAIALKMTSGTGQFIRDYMFPKTKEDTVATISEQLGAYREIKERVEDLEKRIEMLDKIQVYDRELTNVRAEKVRTETVLKCIDIEENIIRLKGRESELESVEKEADEAKKEQKILQDELQTIRDERARVQAELNNSDYGKKEQELKDLEYRIALLADNSAQWRQIVKGLKRWEEEDVVTDYVSNRALQLIQEIRGGALTEKLCKELRTHLDLALDNITNELSELRISIHETEKDIKEKQDAVEDLQNDRKPYPLELKKARQELQRALSDRYGRKIEVHIFADLFDITDEKWKNAIEGRLGRIKKSMITEPAYALDAAKIFRRMQQFEEVDLINSEAVQKDSPEADENSLYEAVHAESGYVDRCLKRYLGRIQKCETVEELSTVKDGVTPDCYSYSGYMFRHLRRKDYTKNACIGTKVSKAKLRELQEEIIDLQSSLIADRQTEESLKEARQFERFGQEPEHLMRLAGAADELADHYRRQDRLKEEIKEGYYDEIIRRLELGEIVKSPDMEDVDFFRCLNAVVNLKKSLWMRVFSAAVLNDSKRFKKDYEKKVVKVLVRSPLYEEGMTDDEILSVHGILSYAQVMEWKGPLLYKLKGGQEYIEDKAREKEYEIDTSQNQYGTVINSQTLERAFPVSIKGVQRIVTIENKANYEEMKYREDTLYLFCHGFYSPKERIFLKRLMEVAEGEIQYFHWGDMDMGGIRIFRFNKKNIFPKLKPYKMDREAFQEALERGAGIPLEEKKKEKLEKLNAGELEELKKCILEKGVEIEQEILLAENAIAEN